MINRWYLLGAAVLLAGCIDLSGASFSNIGNGNSASNFGNGNSASNFGNGNTGTIGLPDSGGSSGGTNTGGGGYVAPAVDGVRINHDRFVLRRIANFNPNDYRYDSIANRFESNYYMASPAPSVPIINPEECLVRAYALSGGNQIYEVMKDQGDWDWILPEGIQLVSLNTFNGPQAQMLWANQTMATGSYSLRLEYRPNRSISIAATVDVVDQGLVQVEF